MKSLTSLCFLILLLFAGGRQGFAQTESPLTQVADTTIYDDRTGSDGHELILPQMALSMQEYNSFFHKHFISSKIMQENKIYTKLEVARVIEKDGTVSSWNVTGVGPAEVKSEVVRILKLLPPYTPGLRDGKPARFRLYQPFEFKHN
ncbi:hypothetical protein [Pedobacter sp. JY14-1]|uniref:hypothetical protein n=1 Tax=Pedobacter sp. JY14-1 TaxID=3034151 RepID=UPI0023E1814E|nr:hypothetical protein [Pedobacter sp. JY14-1]